MRKFFIYGFGTGLGTGYAPIAPGTAGSLLGLVLFFLFPLNGWYWLVITVLVFFIGVWTSTIIEKEKGEDPPIVVIDEVVGQWVALLFIPFYSLKIYILAFLLFRLFDVRKPPPIDQSQRLKAGYGIMIDDVLAGIYANIILQLIFRTGLWS